MQPSSGEDRSTKPKPTRLISVVATSAPFLQPLQVQACPLAASRDRTRMTPGGEEDDDSLARDLYTIPISSG